MNNKKDVEDACNDDNRKKLSQTSIIPLMHRQLAQEIGFDSTSIICLKILQGNYNVLPDTDDYTTA